MFNAQYAFSNGWVMLDTSYIPGMYWEGVVMRAFLLLVDEVAS